MKESIAKSVGLVAFFGLFLASRAQAQNMVPVQAEECVHDAGSFRCVQFVGNHDGDTITVNIPGVHPLIGRKITVRVLGLDTAEIISKDVCEKNAAVRARQLANEVLKNAGRIDLVNVQRDKYFRILADVIADGVSLKDKLFQAGLAYGYMGGTKISQNWCAEVHS